MMKDHQRLPQLEEQLFLTDGGIETTLIFHEHIDLPYFAAFHLLRDVAGRDVLKRYYERYLAIAKVHALGFILESPTWRASPDWGDKLGYTKDELDRANRDAITMMRTLKDEHAAGPGPIVVSGCVGPRGDGYDPGRIMTAEAAEAYHARQISVFAKAGADMTTAITMTNTNEAIGIVRAATKADLPVAISFTLETDGRLPTGQSLAEALAEVDAETESGPAYYMINCAHPTHFADVMTAAAPWTRRVRGLRANASCRSHQELDNAPDLDMGNPIELGAQYRDLRRIQPQITVLGGCCGTDHHHIEEICMACRDAA